MHVVSVIVDVYTARGKNFARELEESGGKLEILAYSEERNDTIRLACTAQRVPEEELWNPRERVSAAGGAHGQ